MTSPESLARSIRETVAALVEADVALVANTTVALGNRVSWAHLRADDDGVPFRQTPTVGTFRRWLELQHYSFIMTDGALVQMTFDFEAGEISRHRLALVPFPYVVARDEFSVFEISDILELYSEMPHDEISLRSMVRFDFDPAAASENHPHSHLTVNSSSCRIAGEAAMYPRDFLRFIYRNFYPEDWIQARPILEGLASSAAASFLSQDQRREPHLAWTRS